MNEWQATESWRRDEIHYPRPVLPLTVSYCLDPVAGSEAGFEELSLPMRRARTVAINGWAYTRADLLRPEPPAAVQRLLGRVPALAHVWRLDPVMRPRVKGFDELVASGRMEALVSRWDDEWRPEAERRVAVLRAFDRADADDAELARHLDALHDYVVWAFGVHVPIHLICFYVRGMFADVCERLLGIGELDAYELIARSDDGLVEASARLSDIARRAADDPAVLAAVRAGDVEALRATWAWEAIGEFLDAEGDRPISGFEVTEPTFREVPEVVVGMIRNFCDHPFDVREQRERFERWRQSRVQELRARLSGAELDEFDHWLEVGTRAYPLNDTHNYLLAELPWGLVRYAALEAGRRLVAAGSIEACDDVFHLYRPELVAAIRNPTDLTALVRARRAAHEHNLTLDAPPLIGEAQQPPPLSAFPRAAGQAVRVMLSQNDAMTGEGPRAAGSDGGLYGIPGSSGMGEGTARVVLGPEQFHTVREGDVLVCPMTTPAWTVLFPIVSGLVTDSGGPLSHAAIVAREYGLPSVVGTGDATTRLASGPRVRVEGSSGVVRVLDPEPAKADQSASVTPAGPTP